MLGIATMHNLAKVAKVLPAQDVGFACRYYNHNTPSKNLTPDEATALSAAGVQVVAVWENGYPTKLEYFTHAQGLADGERAFAMAKSFNQPCNTAIYFAVDFDGYTNAHREAIIAYFQGIAEAFDTAVDDCEEAHDGYRVGAYGGYSALQWLLDAALIDYCWQAFAPGWSGGANKAEFDGQLHTTKPVSTVAGIDVNVVTARTDDFGGWTL